MAPKQVMSDDDEEPLEIYPEDLWDIIFPFDEAYEAQVDGIEEVITTATDEKGGYVVLEGACGTGKTLLSLVAGLSMIRSPMTDIERIFVTTSVKQQLEAFEDDLQTINDNLRSLNTAHYDMPASFLQPITALTLVGKPDVCPYQYSGHIDTDYIYQNCSDLMEQTDEMIDYYQNKKSRIAAANKLASDADAEKSVPEGTARDVEDPDTHPYREVPPDVDGTPYCPYYAQWRLDDMADNEPINSSGSILTPKELTKRSLQQGTCPHAAMKEVAPDAEVVIANYTHILQPQTVQAFTSNLMGDETFLICDEAHTLTSKAREEFSKSATITQLHEAVDEIDRVIKWAEKGPAEAMNAVEEAFSRHKITASDLKEFQTLIEDTIDYAESAVPSGFKRADSSMQKLRNLGPNMERSEHVPLTNPEDSTRDDITKAYDFSGYGGNEPPIATLGGQIGDAIGNAHHEVSKVVSDVDAPGDKASKTVGPFIQQYYLQNHTDYYREAEILPEDHYKAPMGNADPNHNIDLPQSILLKVMNCIPANKLANTFDKFGSGICMSATISPAWVYRGETGLNYLDHKITDLQYGLQFPEENRATVAVDVPKFTSGNRRKDWADSKKEEEQIESLRDDYYTAIKKVVTETPGNVLIAGPSYAEADWAADRLESDSDVSKEVLRDGSSDNGTTQKLREQFIEGPPKVLTTGMRGTLTEGVDFSGDALKAVGVFGVPIAHIGNPSAQATIKAYDEQFTEEGTSGAGFQYAFGIPAVRKARQAIGRVIRSGDDVGTRVLIDGRYTSGAFQGYLSEEEQAELEETDPDSLDSVLQRFWERQ